MSTGLLISLFINIVVGSYLLWFWPRSLRKNFPNGRLPPAFALAAKILPPLGAVLIVASLLYGVLVVTGLLGA